MINPRFRQFMEELDLSNLVIPKTRQTTTSPLDTPVNLILDPSDFIKLSSFTLDGTQVNMLVGKYVARVAQKIEQALNSLGYLKEIKNQQGNVTQRGYTRENIWINDRLGSLNWHEQILLAESLGCARMDNKQAIDFHNHIKKGIKGKVKVLDGDDNDGDDLWDDTGGNEFGDPGCWFESDDPFSGYNPNDDNEGDFTSQCQDLADNDVDKLIDLDDADCTNLVDYTES